MIENPPLRVKAHCLWYGSATDHGALALGSSGSVDAPALLLAQRLVSRGDQSDRRVLGTVFGKLFRVRGKLGEIDPADSAYFQQRFQDFDKRLTAAEQKWDAEMAPFRGSKVVTYHNSFTNFAKHFHLSVIGYVEPRPGIPPTPSHTLDLIGLMKRENCKLVLVEPYFDMKTPNSIGAATGAKVQVYLPSVGGEKQVTNYFELFDYDIALLKKAFQ